MGKAAPAKKATTARRTATSPTPPRRAAPQRAAAAPRPSTPRATTRKRPPAPAYRPNYWLIGAMAILLVGLAVAVLISISVLWTLAGPFTTTVMVLAYGAVMFALWKVGVSRM